MAPDDPPPKKYDLKERSFKRENVPGAAGPTAKELAMISNQRAAVAPKPKAGPKADDPNDVYQVLQQNRAVENELGLDQIEIRKVQSRRRRDYWLLMLICNAALGFVAFSGRGNFFVLVSAAAGMIIVSIGLTWIMWQVMGRY